MTDNWEERSVDDRLAAGVGDDVSVARGGVVRDDVSAGVGDGVGDGVRSRPAKGQRACTDCQATAAEAGNGVRFSKVLVGF